MPGGGRPPVSYRPADVCSGAGAQGPETGAPVAFASTTTVGRSLAWLGGATGVQQASAFVLGVIIRAILGPARTGVWNLVEVWRQQLSSFSLGTSAAADRDMPELRAQGRVAEESLVRSVAFTFTMGEAAAVAIGFWAYWGIAAPRLLVRPGVGARAGPVDGGR